MTIQLHKAMKIQKIEIKNLFDQFDYDIPLTNPEDLLILTAPNGFGKTMVLNIIDSLFNKRFHFFHKLVFDSIRIVFEENLTLHIKKDDNKDISFLLFDGDLKMANYSYSILEIEEVINFINENIEHIHFNELEYNWHDFAGNIIDMNKIVQSYNLPEYIKIKYYDFIKKYTPILSSFLSTNKTYLIKEQRLLTSDRQGTTIEKHTLELQAIINRMQQEVFNITYNLDSTFPKRLLAEKQTVTEQEFISRFETLRQKQAKLHKYGLSESEQEVPPYSEENARLLSVYLNDIEKKVGVFDNLIQKIDLFTTILNERRFTFKTILINKEKGFYFVTNKGKELSLTDLSSGEQHEIVLLYELIFRTSANTLVLIDEPEISLHVTWQKEFLKDLLAIIALQKMQVIVATHSPSIINDRWDLVFNLQTKTMQ